MTKIKAEFHVHTRYSKDSMLNKYFILMMCKIKKIKLLAITDHNEIMGAIKYKKFLKKFGIDVIVGEEIMTKEGEIIGLYLKERISPMLTIEETINELQKQKALIYLPHPYDKKRYKTVLSTSAQEKYHKYFDFIEIHNGRNISDEFTKKQEKIQKKYKANAIVGSDAHTFFELGRNNIIMNKPTKDTLKKSVEDGKLVKKDCIMFAHKWTRVVRVLKMLVRGELGELFRIINRRRKKRNKKTI